MQLLMVILIGLLCGCADIHYSRVKEGKLEGKLLVEWIDPDLFIFTPDKDRPLIFTRYNKDSIKPGRMFTDGGSIPRPLWVIRSYSPWGYAPAFIVHDWLFEMHHCHYEGYEKYSLEEAAQVMSEVMKTMMLDPKRGYEDKLTLYAMYEAVKLPIAREFWETGGCKPPPSDIERRRRVGDLKPKATYVIEFP